MRKVITLGASSSKKSINKAFAEFAGSQLQGKEIINLDLNDYDLPLYSIDLENEAGFPEDLHKLDAQVVAADGFIISLAEHNGAYSAAFKNAFDWLSRIEGKVWRNKPLLLLSTSPGARGGASVLELAKARFPYNGGQVAASMSLPSFYDNFKAGELQEESLRADFDAALNTFEKAVENGES